MSVFQRISDIVTANLNSLLDRVEDPEAMLDQIVREMEEGLVVARRHAATTIAAAHRLGRELEANRAAASQWKTKAREALIAGREDLARLALVRKREQEKLARSLETQHAEAQQACQQVRTSLRAVEARLAEARRKQRALVARHRALQACRAVHRVSAERFPWPGTSAAKLERWENRLSGLEDELRAQAEIDGVLASDAAEFNEWSGQRDIDRELEELKRELAGS